MKLGLIKLTAASNGNELLKNDPIHINFHRVQAMWVVKSGSHEDMTLIEMNVMKGDRPLTYYVTEEPKKIYEMLDEG